MSLEIVILAAGQGTRMRSALPKVLHPVAGNSMLGHVIHSARQLDPQRIHVVIGHGADVVRERLAADDLNFVLQDKQLGTGHATAQAVPFISADTVLILYGDVPLIEVETLQRLLKQAGQLGSERATKPILEINTQHALVQRLQADLGSSRADDIAHILFDQAVLAEGGHLADPVDYVKMVNALFTA